MASPPSRGVPQKVTSDVDFSSHLRSVIQRTYGEAPDHYTDEIHQLNRARQDALRGSAGSDVTARDLLYKYFGQLELLELRFPELRVPFPWNDAFTHVKIAQLSLAYEKASVIFNIGATLSSLAASSPRSSPEGLKRAFHSFRCAAGMFTYINDNFLHAPSTDLSREVVKVLVGLMSAQAIEVFIETMGPSAAVTKGAGLRAKLCMQASMAYANVIEEVKEWVTKNVFIREWSLLIQASQLTFFIFSGDLFQVKAKYFTSLAQYNRSLADSTSLKYGEALARLNIAEAAAKEALRLANAFAASFSTSSSASSLAPDSPVTLIELNKTHLGIVTEAKNKAQKDNDIVYNEVVPSEASLAPIDKGKDVAEPIAIHDVYATPEVQKIVGPDLFIKLVPLSVHESASMYSEEKAKVVRGEVERSDLADGELVAALEYMGLPASLERYRTGTSGQASLSDVGPQVRTWSEQLRRDEAQGRVDDSFRKLQQIKDNVTRQLDSVLQGLDQESRECEAMRVRFDHLWEQTPAAGLTKSYRQDLRSHKESLEQASHSDAQALGLWDGVKNDVALLCDPSGQALERAFIEAVGSASASSSQANLLDDPTGDEDEEEEIKKRVTSISDNLSKLNKVKKERHDVLKDLKERVQADDISHLLILNRKGSAALEPSLFATELDKFRAHQSRITATLQHQSSTLAEISADFKVISEGKKAREMQGRWGEAERHKRDLITRLGHAAQTYGEVRTALQKGLQFYGDLSELVEGLNNQVRSYLQERDGERSQMASSVSVKQRLEAPSSTTSPSLDRQFGAMDLGSRAGENPSWASSTPPAPPSHYSSPPPPAPPAIPAYPQHAYSSPTPAATSPYSNFPSSGAFSTTLAPQPPSQYSAYPSHYGHNPTSSPPPPPPPSQPYGASAPRPPSSSILPPPPQPVNYSGLPPPSQPVPYGQYSVPALPQHQQQQQYPSSAFGQSPAPPGSTPYQYGGPPPTSSYGGSQAPPQRPHYLPQGQPQPPSRPAY
ncbi:BQ5605_C014g07568 [Microbotryum silenes-dioicae]|uniref:BRO domain-containing protein 1 n=1 Tax=Microbotryum silenes-dioicae TaxID=796604 RepID=A0A2X0LUA0_9BASI|nr:BQ5605_C014g07568 [Microbotryum silenes-dioicae]